jgi:hypothetical protein
MEVGADHTVPETVVDANHLEVDAAGSLLWSSALLSHYASSTSCEFTDGRLPVAT